MKMKVYASIIISFFTFHPIVFGQHATESLKINIENTGSLTGILKDSIANNALPLATVSLFRPNGKVVSETLTDKSGVFQIKNIPYGSYYITFSATGYELKKTEIFNITKGKSTVDLGVMVVLPFVKQLTEVSVRGRKQIIKIDPDKITYSVEDDITNRGASALDALIKAPLISLSANDQITLKGSTDYKVYINGKASPLYTGSLSEILKTMPSESIKEIEIITNPSAKYDAEGVGGIINIITQKKLPAGYSGSVFSGINSIGDYNAGIQGAVSYGKFSANLLLSAGKYHRPNNTITVSEENYTDSGTQYLSQNQVNLFKSSYLSGSLDLNYLPDSLNTLSASILLYDGNNSTTGTLNSEYLKEDFSIDNAFERDIFRKTHYLTTEVNAGYMHNFTTPAQNISVNYRLSYAQPEIYYQTLQSPIINADTSAEKNYNNEVNQESAFQIDYVQPISEKHLLEVGAKEIYRDLESRYTDSLGSSYADLVLNPAGTDQLKYEQYVSSGYALYTFKGKAYTIKAGSRIEHTDINAHFSNDTTQIKQSYNSFIPNFSASLTLNHQSILRFSYIRRIQRPGLFYLNPFVNQINPQSISYGNPNLRPEYTDSYEAGYNINRNKAQFNFVLYYQKTSNSIESYRFLQQDSILVSTYSNFGKQSNLGLNIYISSNFIKRLSISGNITTAYYHAQLNSDNASEYGSGFNFKASINSSYSIIKGLAGFLTAAYYSPVINFQSRSFSYFLFSFGLTKDVLAGKGSVTLNFNQPFYYRSTYKTAYSNSEFYQLSTNRYSERFLRVNFRYRFGKTRTTKSVIKIKNDDLKSSG